jgi:L-amino acid N-acyltransferase YncA
MKIRNAREADLGQILDLWWELNNSHVIFDRPYYSHKPVTVCRKMGKKHYSSWLKKRGHLILVAEENGKIIGYLAGRKTSRPPIYRLGDCGMVDTIIVDKASRRRDAGRLLMEAAVAEFKKMKLKMVVLNVESGNTSARKFYSKTGFRERMVQEVKDI